ncbi:MAG: bifunctional (p)ppGpp synthetase/guanosine-3',5'-bis(diphosphate) 3'-pyrophosphohydrolase [Bacilli bacterium]|nr:bifunctional (p)ppGpp synthetase/guanosine-3',5'-bis(diphosphate) 3'-pyrophosphohydrolase [Bacilli bacterium]MDD4282804.1 bifunctional (p)ppGpp synthetase/guanosine-3',5'-bis(diphosphate) 3'-pyrophosphohydrolase [Bacilli bacterium]MDD4718881.1 bifunctional (p)ppGpp synthetase/guanosine-3',5'-bis(diphosphate) 3'-pyrophosphohydrolase [Bacilli bacterium]
MNNKREMVTFEKLRDKFLSYSKDEHETEIITKAYLYAYEKHFGVKRLTEEDYVDHPLNVAYILTGIYADNATICAALLHDVLEDCDASEEELIEKFGPEINSLVVGVTKINKLNFTGENEAMIANHRKIIVGLSEDVRVIIIKLADRLHNMRTLWVLPEKKQKEKARETLDILIPIAHRLGMNQIKSELEDLSLRYLKPDVYYSIVENLNQSKGERDNTVKDMVNKVTSLLAEHGIKNEVKGRAKSIFSIYKKLDTGRKFSDIYDLLALRVFVDTEQECYQALGILHSKYRPIPKRFKDFIAMPKTNMYQSLHTTVFGMDGNLFEIQIRTYDMDKIAEHGIASHWSYKEKGKNHSMQSTMEQKLQFFRSIIELKNTESDDEEFVDSVKEDVFKNTIYVFSPKGDVIELPKGSNPIDFAYRVHTEVGDKMVGAIVNGSIVALDYQLKDDDIIKINVNKNSTGPSKEWINMAKTVQAKNKIKAFFNRNDKVSNIKRGEELIAKELRKRKISFNDFFTPDNVNKILEELKCTNIEELYINIGINKVPTNQLINIITNDNESKEEIILKKAQTREVTTPVIKNDIVVEGIDDIKVNVASCCKPIPGDRIVGYITKGYGITVHRMVCPNISDLDERIIEVRWNEIIDKKYPTSILVEATNIENLLLNIIAKTANSSVVVQNINAITKNNNYLYEIVVLVEHKENIIKFMDEIKLIPSVVAVERIIK